MKQGLGKLGLRGLTGSSRRKAAATLLVTVGLTLASISSPAVAASAMTPEQIGLSMTSEPQTSISVTWTTLNTVTPRAGQVVVWQSNKRESSAVTFQDTTPEIRTVSASTIPGATQKTFFSVKVTGLKSDTRYSYRVGSEGAMSEVRSFTTAPDNNGQFTFVYFSDSQIGAPHEKSWQMNLEMAEQTVPDAEFLYMAGDLTNTAANEGQWEGFFNQEGNTAYNTEYEGNLISDLPLAAVMGNHDSSSAGVGGMASHYLWDSDVPYVNSAGLASQVPVCYAFDYGAARMILLNLENAYSRDNAAARDAQLAFLAQEVNEAKAQGKWTIVGFHKSLYSGANHMDDSDVIYNRRFWAPQFAALDVDVVLQGHDHVLSRGFVAADGYKVDVTRQIGDREYMAKDPANAPLYYVGNTASSLKFYAPIMSNAWILPGDPVAPDFGYLDINSALPAGYTNAAGEVLNAGPCTNDDLEGTDPDFFRTPTFTSITVTNGYIEFNTYMTGYNQYTNQVVEDTFRYDTIKVTR